MFCSFVDGHAGADRDGQPVPRYDEWRFFDGGPQPLGLLHGGIGGAARQDDQEFLAAVSADPVVIAQLGLEAPSDLTEYSVPGRMPVCVVDQLEVIDVGEHDADKGSVTSGAG